MPGSKKYWIPVSFVLSTRPRRPFCDKLYEQNRAGSHYNLQYKYSILVKCAKKRHENSKEIFI